ncbi:MAG: hypothetical protein ABW278_00505 [Steroidobacteraceae bacterium]
MFRRLRHRPYRRLRLAAMLLFALGLAAQSLLGVLGEMHELAVHTDAADGLASHLVAHDHAAATADGSDASEGGALHVLLHYTHCCGHTIWMSGVGATPLVASTVSAHSPGDPARQVPLSQRTAPFRPPIPA